MGYIQSGKSKVKIANVSETVTSAANVSQYPVESGASIIDNMVYTGGPVTISGWIPAKNGNAAEQAYSILAAWQKDICWTVHRGRLYFKNATIQDISKGYDTMENGFTIIITLQPTYVAKTIWEKIPQPPVAEQPSKPSNVAYVTVQPGNTYWGWWQQYGTPTQ